ncbi:MAG: hypothetical protein DRO88_06035 [Promethearchaeia archaeon]|nr:MAG: hypothetical protein DRO88_06035 [Candidatus Lokiarchaeia archaeon]
MSTLSSRPVFIFDANFFIGLKEIRAESPYTNLALAKKKLNLRFYVSAQVFNECPFIVGSNFRDFTKGIEVVMVKDKELNHVKDELFRRGVKLMAQDPDLSLVALGMQLNTKDNEVYIVSDDFKLSQNIENLNQDIKCLPLPSFLQMLGQNLKGVSQRYWKLVRKKILKLNLDYMMSRSDIYAPQAKIAWFIENSIDIAGMGVNLRAAMDEDEKEKEVLDSEKKILNVCNDYIRKRKISPEDSKKIKHFEKSLKKIQKERENLIQAQKYLMKNDFKNTLKILRRTNEILNRDFQLMGAKLREKDYQLLEQVFASEISKVVFLRCFVLIASNKFISALDALDQTALFATVARLPETVLAINYLKALLYILNSYYNKAIDQFKFNYNLAMNLHVRPHIAEILQLKAVIGNCITNYLIDQQNEAFKLVTSTIKSLTSKSIPNLMQALLDSGEYFLAMGFPEIASNLYSEALECAIDSKKKWKYSFILGKMKEAYMASALIGTEIRPSADISILIDKFHDLEDFETFNDLMVQLAQFTNKFYEPFPFFTKDKRKKTPYNQLPDVLKSEWQCVKIEESKKNDETILIGFNEKVGLVAFSVLLDRTLEGVPENYILQLKPHAKVIVEKPSEIDNTAFLIRAMIRLFKEERDIAITRKIPIFFKQLHA